jgi:hypothetical protein
MARPIARAYHALVYKATGRWELSENGLTVFLFGVIQNPGEEGWSVAKRGAVSLGHQESAPLGSGKVLLKEGQDRALLVLEMVTKGSPEVGEHRRGRPVG